MVQSKAKITNAKINKEDYNKLETFSTAKEINKMKRQCSEWDKALHLKPHLIKGECSIYRKRPHSSTTKTQSDFQMGRRSESTFFQIRHTDGQPANKKMLKITHQGNANWNHDITSYLSEQLLSKRQKVRLHEEIEKENANVWLVGM